ncbi:MAG: hypothetical protein E6Q68_08145 [Polynucleobacter sp.]|nr:MAG: hypothetical protein E6Q68_08145 [Polynucleobacter sp.]
MKLNTLESTVIDGCKTFRPLSVNGYKVEGYPVSLFVYKRSDDLWSVTEAKSGFMIATGKTRKSALETLQTKTASFTVKQWTEAAENALLFAASRGYINGPIN